jgi:putative ABC transport system permease protein
MQTFFQDLRYALRQIVRHPGYALSTVLTLALGIGTNTAIFSMVHGVLLRPLPYAGGDRLVHIGHRDPGPDVSDVFFSAREMDDYRKQTRALASLHEYHSMTFTLVGEGEPDRVRTGVVSAGFFDSFGVRPLLGRSFIAGEDQPGAAPVLLLSHAYWRRHFSGNPGIVGKTVILDDKPTTVVGVLPALPQFPDENDVFVLPPGCSVRSSERAMTSRRFRMLSLFGRLQPDATVDQARAELASVLGGWSQEEPDLYPDEQYHDVPVVPVHEELTGKFRPTLLILLATVGLVLLLACLNVANLTLARMMRRQREMAVRSALGAGRDRVIRQLLTESTVLALVGGAVGIAFAFAGLKLLIPFASRFTPRASEIAIDGPVLLLTVIISLLTGLLFGLFPAFQAAVRNAATALRAGSGRSTVSAAGRRFRALLTLSQVAISFILLIGAGLSVRSFLALRQVDTGFAAEKVVAMTLTLPSSRSGTAQVVAFFEPLLERLKSVPGVVAAGVASDLPLEDDGFNPPLEIEGRTLPDDEEARANFDIASSGFFQALRIPLVRGRTFTAADAEGAPPVVIINESFARRYWLDRDPVGQRVRFNYRGGGDWLTVVGVVGDVKQLGLDKETGPAFYLSFHQVAGQEMRLFVRTAGDPLKAVPNIVELVHQRAPELPVADIRGLAEVRDNALAPVRLTAVLLTLLAVLACTIAVLGISGVVASGVTERTNELGIRSALGAGRGSLLGTVLWRGMAPVLIGLTLGAVGALGLTRFLSSILFGVVPNDLLTYLAVAALLLVASALACLVPARHALNIDPLLALRYE